MTRIRAPWITAPATRAVLDALGGQAWFVGGCVRNALIGAAVTDVDLATPLVPDEVIGRLEAAGLKAVPTGIAHGTVTAVAEDRAFEITTFRADLATDGRRALVRFSTEMAEDAARRDFTINALYADAAGTVIDPLGAGLADLRARRVRFIGAPERRIAEDHLRILRFFRFSAWYAGPEIDGPGLAACTRRACDVAGLARERVGHEIRRLLAAPDPARAVAAMAGAGVLERVLPGADPEALPALVAAERSAGAAPDWCRRLALIDGHEAADRLRLSRAETRDVAELSDLAAEAAGPALDAEAKGPRLARSAALIRAARQGSMPPDDLEAELARGAAAQFPLSAADLMAAGHAPGPALGRALSTAHERWRASDFALDKAALISEVLGKGQ